MRIEQMRRFREHMMAEVLYVWGFYQLMRLLFSH
jgi:hypothetical protein